MKDGLLARVFTRVWVMLRNDSAVVDSAYDPEFNEFFKAATTEADLLLLGVAPGPKRKFQILRNASQRLSGSGLWNRICRIAFLNRAHLTGCKPLCSEERIWRKADDRHFKNGKKPIVDLDEPDITVVAEVLEPITMVGVLRNAWRAIPSEQSGKAGEEYEKSSTNAAAANPTAQAAA